MKALNFTVIKLTLCLIIGILIAFYCSISWTISLILVVALFSFLLLFFFIAKKQFHKTIWFGLVAYLTMIMVGVLCVNFHNQKNFNNHYKNYLSLKSKQPETITFKIRELLKPSAYSDKYVIDILKIDNTNVRGKSLLNVYKDSTLIKFKVDDILITKKSFTEINTSPNPNQFDYKTYLEKQYIYNQLYMSSSELYKTKIKVNTLMGYANKFREQINFELNNYNFEKEELAIINALILGQRQNISKEVQTHYTNAGAIHILAVSGLHIGIVLLILNFILKPIEQIKKGKIIKLILILLLLWSYALIAGASASIIRATTMFSVVAVGMHVKRPSNIYNTLALSIFIILLFKPLFIFDVGFQLSYLAVFAIVSIQPLLYNLISFRIWVIDKLWQIFTVTLAAQFGVIPISLYYFHQFPGLFWLSNLVVIPFIGIILAFGILIISLALLKILPQILANIFGFLISLMNSFFEWISNQSQFLIQNISFDFIHVIASYLFIIALVRLYVKRNFHTLRNCLIAILLLQGVFVFTNYSTNTNSFVILNKSRHSIILEKHNNNLIISHSVDSLENNKMILNYKISNHIKRTYEDSLKSLYLIGDKKLLVIDSLGIYSLKSVKPDYVLLRNSPKINLKRMIDSLKPRLIIADASNYKTYVKRWSTTCTKQKLPFHYTSKKGAFIIHY
ncbi:ComEC/Rec2 family competence protein [Lacinutrix salivirga]